MVKNILIVVLILVFVGVAVYFFARKSNNADQALNISPSPSASSSPISSGSASPMPSIPMDKISGQDLVVGTGATAKAGDKVKVNYIGTLLDGTKFDSSYDRGTPFEFTLGAGQVIQGWDIGVAGMKVGGKRELIIPPQFGYGNKANGPIPANSVLVFQVELLAVTPAK